MLIKNNLVTIKNISATDFTKVQQKIKGDGTISQKDGKYVIKTKINVKDFYMAEIKGLKGSLSGEILINGIFGEKVTIAGELFSDNFIYDITSIIARANHSLGIIDISKKPKVKKPKNQVTTPSWCSVQVNVFAKNNFKVVGNGVESLWDGHCSISGPINKIDYLGKLVLKKGKITISGKKLSITEGQVTVSSECPGVFFVDISSTKKLDNMELYVKFLQNKKETAIKLSSNPSMPQKDVLSYILFEKKASEITEGETVILLAILGRVSGGESFDIIDKIKTMFGLDSIEIKRAVDNQNNEYGALSIGKKIGKVKVSVDQGAGDKTTKVTLETKIGKQVKAIVDHSSSNAIGAGIMWSKKY
jgi:translocation and assembly module TamB